MQFTFIEGGVCAPKGFTANGMRVGIKESRKINEDIRRHIRRPSVYV